ncbi:MAG: TatD family hydrolase [Candidatus Moranbacteria bacterium]|nr:TatD family hydrolase [Candidatus Moranbacteria bacterium]
MIDTHAHLDFEKFDEDRDEVIARFFAGGGKAIVNIGVDLATSKKSIDLAENYENIFSSVGFHPHDASEKLSLPTDDNMEELKKIAANPKVKAIGEIGLDYSCYKNPDQIKQQKALFEKQLSIAEDLNLPVVVHCRDAWDDVYEIISNIQYPISNKNQDLNLKKNPISSKVRPFPSSSKAFGIPQGQTLTKFVLHCYSGNKNDTEKFLELPDIYFSFSGNITYPKPAERANDLAEAIKMIPIDRIMLDSDSPFLAPQEFRGKRNEPIYIRYIAQKIAEIKNIGFTEVEEATDDTAIKFFGLKQISVQAS